MSNQFRRIKRKFLSSHINDNLIILEGKKEVLVFSYLRGEYMIITCYEMICLCDLYLFNVDSFCDTIIFLCWFIRSMAKWLSLFRTDLCLFNSTVSLGYPENSFKKNELNAWHWFEEDCRKDEWCFRRRAEGMFCS